LAVDKWIIDDRGKKIDGLYNRQVVAQAHDSSVVGRIETDNHVFVERLFW
jgi:hypothetical protein